MNALRKAPSTRQPLAGQLVEYGARLRPPGNYPVEQSVAAAPVSHWNRQIVVLLLAFSALGFASCRSRQDPIAPRDAEPASAGALLGKNNTVPHDEGFVGSQVCADCHSEISKAYEQTHSMARATSLVGQESPLEDYQSTTFESGKHMHYRVERTAEGIRHSESMTDALGAVLFEQTEPIAYVFGSGRRGRAYLIDRDGLLFQSPISWYSQRRTWDLSPGYQPPRHQRFDRKIETGCVVCHVGRSTVVDYGNDRFARPAFLEPGIGCERCHGPGRAHVAKQVHDSTAGPDDTIVNPQRLTAHQRDSVCYQCHLRADFLLPRSGKRIGDFRPGQAYEDVYLAFNYHDVEISTTLPLVEQFQSSACFQQSAGGLGCVSCHDPHSRPEETKVAGYYRHRCLNCHTEHGCRLPEAEQNAPPAAGSCIHCHMPGLPAKGVPHTALTDHRIQRRPKIAPGGIAIPPARQIETLRMFADAGRRLPQREQDRGWGMVYASLAARGSDGAIARRAIALLNPVGQLALSENRELAGDVIALERLGIAYAIAGQLDLALACWQRILTVEPNNAPVLYSVVMYYVSANDAVRGIEYVDRLIHCDPFLPEYYWIRATMREQLNRIDGAIEDAEAAIKLDPTAVLIRQWLVDVYRRTNRIEEAQRQEDIVRRMLRVSAR